MKKFETGDFKICERYFKIYTTGLIDTCIIPANQNKIQFRVSKRIDDNYNLYFEKRGLGDNNVVKPNDIINTSYENAIVEGFKHFIDIESIDDIILEPINTQDFDLRPKDKNNYWPIKYKKSKKFVCTLNRKDCIAFKTILKDDDMEYIEYTRCIPCEDYHMGLPTRFYTITTNSCDGSSDISDITVSHVSDTKNRIISISENDVEFDFLSIDTEKIKESTKFKFI